MEPIDGKIRILIVDDISDSREMLARLLSFEPDMEVVGFATSGSEAIEKAQELVPDVILMDINMPDMDGITATERISELVRSSVVMISVQSDRDYMRRAMQVGAKDFLPKPPSADELYATVRNAYRALPDEPVISQQQQQEMTKKSGFGRVIVVYSPQGGAGTTSMAVNIASGLMDEQHSTILVDANLQFGDVAVHLAIKNERNVTDLSQAAEQDEIDSDLVDKVVTTHGTGLRVLAAPARPQDAELVSAKAMASIVEALTEYFDYVVVDTSLHLDDVSVELFLLADILVMIAIPTLPSVRNMRVTLDLFDQFEDFNSGKIFFVMNKVPTDRRSGAIEAEAISKALKLQVQAIIPSTEKPFLDSLNRGVPVIVNTRQSPGREVLALIESLKKALQGSEEEMEEDTMAQEQKRGIGRIFGS